MAHVAAWKKDILSELEGIIKEHRTVAVVKIDRIPSLQLQSIRGQLRKEMTFKVAKKTMIRMALENMKGEKAGLEKLSELVDGQAAILGTDLNPFALNKLLTTNMQPMPARGGEDAPHDIVIEAGETPFPPGPIVGELGKVGIPAAIDKGKVVIKKSVTPVKKGQKISKELAAVMVKLQIFPFQVGIVLDGAWEDGLVYLPKDVNIDLDAYRKDLVIGAQMAFNLAVFTSYMTPMTAVPLLQKARLQAIGLAINAGIMNKDTAQMILSKAYGGMLSIARMLSADALDDDLRALTESSAAPAAPAAAPGPTEGKKAAERKQPEEKAVSEDDAMAGLGALFG